MIQEYTLKIKQKENLTAPEMETVMKAVMSGEVAKEDLKEFLLALREKGATVDETTGAARIMRKFATPVKTKHTIILDTCGTGGDKSGTFNISTTVAFVVAGAGVAVAKHGNRSVSSQCGSADIFEALGVNINMTSVRLGECLDTVGIAFLFAPGLHPAMKYAMPARKELGVATIFNILGPLANPAGATHQVMGVFSRELLEPMARVLKNLGLKRAMIVHGDDGLDEVTTTTATHICELKNDEVLCYTVSPEELGISLARFEDLKGGDLKTNVKITSDILTGHKGPKRDIVVLNAACALYVADAVKSVSDGLQVAVDAIDSGKAQEKLEQLKEFSQRGQ